MEKNLGDESYHRLRRKENVKGKLNLEMRVHVQEIRGKLKSVGIEVNGTSASLATGKRQLPRRFGN